jgi:cytochrome bd-type quinol oxidase subunit 2
MLSRAARILTQIQRKLSWLSAIAFGLVFYLPAFAQTMPVITNTAGVHKQICNVFNAMFDILITVSIIMILWAAYLYATAEDDMEQTTRAKKAIFYAAMGVVAALLARGFPLLIGSFFPGGSQGVQAC